MYKPFKDITGRLIQVGDIVAYSVGTKEPGLQIAVVVEYVEKDDMRYNHVGSTITKIKLQLPGTTWVPGVYEDNPSGHAPIFGVKRSTLKIITPSYYKKSIRTVYFEDTRDGLPKRYVIVTGITHNPLSGWNVGERV